MVFYVSSFWNSSTSSPSGPLKKAMRIGIDGSLDRFTSLGSMVTSAPAFFASSMAALQSSTRRAMCLNTPSSNALGVSAWDISK